jgi:hypothetical protein
MVRLFLGIVLVMAAGLLGGCSSFDQQWKQSPAVGGAPAIMPLAGKWEGRWQGSDGHGGDLRAIIVTTEAPSSATGTERTQRYTATFKATFLALLSGEHSVELVATRQPDGRMNFQGRKDLGFLCGGTYTYDGHVTQDQFVANFQSALDHGTFTMTRVAGGGGG